MLFLLGLVMNMLHALTRLKIFGEWHLVQQKIKRWSKNDVQSVTHGGTWRVRIRLC